MSTRQGRQSNGTATTQPQSAAGKLFDLRLLIGGLFVFYGAVLIVAGLLASSAELHKAADININLWMGIGMFVLGALFLLWRQVSPLQAQAAPAPERQQPVPPPGVERETRRRAGTERTAPSGGRGARPAASGKHNPRRKR